MGDDRDRIRDRVHTHPFTTASSMVMYIYLGKVRLLIATSHCFCYSCIPDRLHKSVTRMVFEKNFDTNFDTKSAFCKKTKYPEIKYVLKIVLKFFRKQHIQCLLESEHRYIKKAPAWYFLQTCRWQAINRYVNLRVFGCQLYQIRTYIYRYII